MSKSTERYFAFAFGVVFVIALLVLATRVPNPTPFQYTVFRIVLALAAGGAAAMIPGFLTIAVANSLRAGGALAVFVIVYFYSPAELTGVRVKTEQEVEIEKPILPSTGTTTPLDILPTAAALAQPSKWPKLAVTRSEQLTDPAVWGARYESITVDGVRAQLPAGSVIVANEVDAIRGGTLMGTDVTIVARRMANVVIDATSASGGSAEPGTVRLFVKVIENSRVLANGAPGANGLDGAAGPPGRDGAAGRDGKCDGFGGYRGADAGGNGGDGGNGENGRRGGDGQAGGFILVTTVVNPNGSTFDVSGGQAGRGGLGGAAGPAGRAGTGGRGCTGLGGSQSNARDGVPGRTGIPGAPGPSGRSGNPGEYRLVLVKSFDDIAQKVQASPNAQLHTALASR